MKRKTRNKKRQSKSSFNNTVQNCHFIGVKWDEPALAVLATVAKGLENLTTLFKAQNVEIKSLLHIGEPTIFGAGEIQLKKGN